MDGGLGRHDEIAHHHADGDQHPAVGQAGDLSPQVMSGGQEAHIHAGEEQHQPHICIEHTHHDLDDRLALEPEGDDLEQGEKGHNGQQAQRHLLHVGGQAGGKILPHIGGGLQVRDGERGIAEL